MNGSNAKPKTTKTQVAVIGAGLAGLTAAYQLTTGGASVTVFERGHHAGGRAHTVNRDGFHLNLGPHALYRSGEAHKFLESINAVPSGAVPQLTRALGSFDGEVFDLPTSPESITQTKLFRAEEILEFGQFVQSIAGQTWDDVAHVPLSQWLDQNIKHDRVRKVIESFVRLSSYGNNPEQMSTGAAFKQLQLVNDGVLYLDEGWINIITALQNALSDSVAFKYDSKVESVESTDDGVLVTVNGVSQQFDSVVLAVPPQVIQKIIPSALSEDDLANIVPNKAACLDVCLRKLPAEDNGFALGIDEPLYFSVHSKTAKLTPEGGALIHLAVYLGPEDGSHEDEERLIKLLDQLQPGWEQELVYKRFLPNMVASFGTPLARLNGANGLKSPKLDHVPNVYIAGDFVGKGALIADAAVKSALEAAKLLLDTTCDARSLATTSGSACSA